MAESARSRDATDGKVSEPPDSRRSRRLPYVHFIWLCRLERDNQSGLARTVDVSESGVGFITSCEIVRGERLFLVVVTHFGRVSTIAKTTHVNKVDATSYRVGAMIEIIAPTDKATWVKLLGDER